MKKAILVFILMLTSNSFAQLNSASIKLGYFNPTATDGGFIIGYEGGKIIDERLLFGWSIDWFHSNYVDKKLVSEFNQVYPISIGQVNELRAKTNLHEFPILLNFRGEFPVAPLTRFYATGGVGIEFLLINYRSFQNPENDEFKAAFDFSWRIGAGVLYRIGSRSEIFGQIDYHSSEPSWEYEVNDGGIGKRIFERSFDMSGIMARVGLRFFY
ncbi:MAG: hypothetical protein A2315_10020 [Ignavibacteria bacterium RIFOXYB2_FULL_35_12]|nr:MAG: hypothetical protein A2058_15285 [Ignavibacteria bacterium GWA2_36_19]OGU51101.1 MAG: hypothetical protein A2006_02000 [Ignavibacteria bacterium GWC2_35_8]OGU57100.1 MAG: hypothetical protein A2X60_12545 [Ignavibacteria bacterium GWF2_35_20]OGU88860.1 MAG: hypothetical protein A3K31_01735 [Ignavibacteria bacterium RIFOXYA12_FULL_35_25]OGU90642.1 MAG: hypothetical protein A2492_09320 [Ignavibacteria bacterium RIFOXYC12_FULL_35_11]OGU93664.1 MAG: hypothetical protein A2347_12035 [Ignavib